MSEHVVVIKTDMTVCTRELDTGDILGSLQALVGEEGPEIVTMKRLPPPHMMVVNEEGKLKGLPVNFIASWLYGVGERICGTAVVLTTGIREGEPDIVGLPKDLADEAAGSIRERFLDVLRSL